MKFGEKTKARYIVSLSLSLFKHFLWAHHFTSARPQTVVDVVVFCLVFLQCGNGVQEMEEDCDGLDLGNQTCQSILGSPWVTRVHCSTLAILSLCLNQSNTLAILFLCLSQSSTLTILSSYPGQVNWITVMYSRLCVWYIQMSSSSCELSTKHFTWYSTSYINSLCVERMWTICQD